MNAHSNVPLHVAPRVFFLNTWQAASHYLITFRQADSLAKIDFKLLVLLLILVLGVVPLVVLAILALAAVAFGTLAAFFWAPFFFGGAFPPSPLSFPRPSAFAPPEACGQCDLPALVFWKGNHPALGWDTLPHCHP
jgi:hypothetical protein